MNTVEEKAFLKEQQVESPSSLNPSSACCFLRFMIRSDRGRSTLLAFISTLAGSISFQSGQFGGSGPTIGHAGLAGIGFQTHQKGVVAGSSDA